MRTVLVRSLLGLSLALSATLALPACSDGEGTLFYITTHPPASPGEDPLVVYHTKANGYDDTRNAQFTVYVEVHGTHGKEFLPYGVNSKGVEFFMYTFDGPPFTQETVELRSQKRSTVTLADAFAVSVGSMPIPVPHGGGATSNAQFLQAPTGAINLQRVCANDLIDVKVGTTIVQLNFDQLQGIGKFIQQITTQRTE